MECLAVLQGVNAYLPYLAPTHCDGYTDQSAKISLQTTKDSKGRAARWALSFQGFDFNMHEKEKKQITGEKPECMMLCLADHNPEQGRARRP